MDSLVKKQVMTVSQWHFSIFINSDKITKFHEKINTKGYVRAGKNHKVIGVIALIGFVRNIFQELLENMFLPTKQRCSK